MQPPHARDITDITIGAAKCFHPRLEDIQCEDYAVPELVTINYHVDLQNVNQHT